MNEIIEPLFLHFRKKYFANCLWMTLHTGDGAITIKPLGGFATAAKAKTEAHNGAVGYIGVYTPCDERGYILCTLPETGVALLKVIPSV